MGSAATGGTAARMRAAGAFGPPSRTGAAATAAAAEPLRDSVGRLAAVEAVKDSLILQRKDPGGENEREDAKQQRQRLNDAVADSGRQRSH